MGEMRKWAEMTEEEQKPFREVYGTIKKLQEFSNKANLNVFNNIFGNVSGEHFAEKFIECKRDALKFFESLDMNNRAIFVIAVFDFKEDMFGSVNPIYF